MKKRHLLIVGLLSLLIFSSCSRENEPNTTPNNPQIVGDGYKLNPSTKLIDGNWDKNVSETVTDSVIELTSTAGLTMPKVGDILIKMGTSDKFPSGFLGKVVAVNQSGGGAEIVTTEDVPLDEAFEELTVNDSIDMVNSITSVTDSVGNPIPFTKGQTSQSQMRASKVSVNGGTSVGDTITIPVNVEYGKTASLKGFVTVGLKLDFNLNIQQNSLKSFKVAVALFSYSDLALTSEFSGNGEVCIATIPLPPITIPPGIVITPKVKLYAVVSFTGKITLNVKLDNITSNTFGCGYDGSNWYTINENNTPSNQSPLSGSFSIEGGIGVGNKAKLQFSLFNNDRMSVAESLKALLAITVNFNYDPTQAASGSLYEILQGENVKLSIPIEGEVDIAFHLFKFLSVGMSFPYDKEFVLGQQPLVPPFTDLNATDGSSPNEKTVSYTSTSSVFFPGGYGIKLYDDQNNLLQTQYYNNTYSLPISTVSIDFNNLTAGKSYIARPVFNMLGLFEIVGNQSTTFTVKDSVSENSDWVLINGVKWAACNVGASSPENYGNYYTWDEAQKYRLPRLAEIQSLLNTFAVSYEYTPRNGVMGCKFTDRATGNSLFMPFCGYICVENGIRYWRGSTMLGSYWCNTGTNALVTPNGNIGFDDINDRASWYSQSFELAIRLVAE